MSDEDTLLEFPCRFPIKALGRDSSSFPALVIAEVESSAGPVAEEDVVVRSSRNGHYLSVTVTFTATSKQQIDGIYRALTASEEVLVLL